MLEETNIKHSQHSYVDTKKSSIYWSDSNPDTERFLDLSELSNIELIDELETVSTEILFETLIKYLSSYSDEMSLQGSVGTIVDSFYCSTAVDNITEVLFRRIVSAYDQIDLGRVDLDSIDPSFINYTCEHDLGMSVDSYVKRAYSTILFSGTSLGKRIAQGVNTEESAKFFEYVVIHENNKAIADVLTEAVLNEVTTYGDYMLDKFMDTILELTNNLLIWKSTPESVFIARNLIPFVVNRMGASPSLENLFIICQYNLRDKEDVDSLLSLVSRLDIDKTKTFWNNTILGLALRISHTVVASAFESTDRILDGLISNNDEPFLAMSFFTGKNIFPTESLLSRILKMGEPGSGFRNIEHLVQDILLSDEELYSTETLINIMKWAVANSGEEILVKIREASAPQNKEEWIVTLYYDFLFYNDTSVDIVGRKIVTEEAERKHSDVGKDNRVNLVFRRMCSYILEDSSQIHKMYIDNLLLLALASFSVKD